MNLPNKLTMLRMFMIPLFLLFFFAALRMTKAGPMVEPSLNGHIYYYLALIVFAAASLTDMLDGKIARKHGLITDFGKLMDPLADKLLVMSALCCLLPEFFGIFGTISLILILAREFLVTSVRLIAAGKGEVLAADIWGKIKTVIQMVWICLMLLGLAVFTQTAADASGAFGTGYVTVLWVLLALMVAVTVASGVHYIVKNRKLFADA